MKATISLDELRKSLSHIVGRVMYGNETVIVQKHQKIGVVLISEKEYEYLKDPRKRFSSAVEWEQFFDRNEAIGARMSKEEQQELEKIIETEVQAVRSKKLQK